VTAQGDARGAGIGRALHRLQAVEKAVAVLAIVIAAGALVADLLGRELFGHGLFGAQRAAVHLTFVAGLLGFVLATGVGAHLRVKASDALLPARFGPGLTRAGDVVSFGLLLALAWYSGRFVLETFHIGERSPTLPIPIWPVQAVMTYAFFSAALRHAGYAAFPALKPASADELVMARDTPAP